MELVSYSNSGKNNVVYTVHLREKRLVMFDTFCNISRDFSLKLHVGFHSR
jgi:hypothetical protein